MKQTYQLLIHGHGFNVAIDDESGKISGFFTARRIKASNHDEALRLGLENFKLEKKIESLVEGSLANGARPQFEVDELFVVPIWKTLFHRFRPGLIFYEEEENISSTNP